MSRFWRFLCFRPSSFPHFSTNIRQNVTFYQSNSLRFDKIPLFGVKLAKIVKILTFFGSTFRPQTSKLDILSIFTQFLPFFFHYFSPLTFFKRASEKFNQWNDIKVFINSKLFNKKLFFNFFWLNFIIMIHFDDPTLFFMLI